MGDISKYAGLAAKATSDFIKHNTDLTENITKLAWDNDLNQEEIKRVCEAANHTTQEFLMRNAAQNKKEKTFTFKTASAKEVIESLGEKRGKTAGMKKTAGVSTRTILNFQNIDPFNSELPEISKFSPDEIEIMKKTLEVRQQRQKQQEKFASDAEDSDNSYREYMLTRALQDLFKEVKSLVEYDEIPLFMIKEAVCNYMPDKSDKMEIVFNSFGNELTKQANPVDEDLICPKLRSKNPKVKQYDGEIMVLNGHSKMLHILDAINELSEHGSCGCYRGDDSTDEIMEETEKRRPTNIKKVIDVSNTEAVAKYMDTLYRKDMSELLKRLDKNTPKVNPCSLHDTPRLKPIRIRRKGHMKKRANASSIPSPTNNTDTASEGG